MRRKDFLKTDALGALGVGLVGRDGLFASEPIPSLCSPTSTAPGRDVERVARALGRSVTHSTDRPPPAVFCFRDGFHKGRGSARTFLS